MRESVMPRSTKCSITELENSINDVLGSETEFERQGDGMYEFDDELVSLIIRITDERLEIRSIDVHGNKGIGTDVIEAIHEFADDIGLDVYALNVRSDAEGFWIQMGYQENQESGTFYRECL